MKNFLTNSCLFLQLYIDYFLAFHLSFFKKAFNFIILLNLLKNCKDSIEGSHTCEPSFSLLLKFYISVIYLSQLTN